MVIPSNEVQSDEQHSNNDIDKDVHIHHHENQESNAVSSMFADAALATGELWTMVLLRSILT